MYLHEKKVYKASKWNVGVFLFCLGGISLHQLYIAFDPAEAHTKILSLVMFGIVFSLFLVTVWAFTQITNDLVLEKSGIRFTPLRGQIGVTFVPWREMTGANTKRLGRIWHVVVKLRESEFSRNLVISNVHKRLYGTSFILNNTAISANIDDLCENINNQIYQNNIHPNDNVDVKKL